MYGPFDSYNSFRVAMADWEKKTKKINDIHQQDFEDDVQQAILDVISEYYKTYGCHYGVNSLRKALGTFEDAGVISPWDLKDLIDEG